jgi:hypothetical protein
MEHKNRTLISCLAVGVLILGLAAGAHAQENKSEALLGTWDVQTEDASFSFVFKFSLAETKLVGTFSGSSGDSEMQNLAFEDGFLKFHVDINGMIIDFSATVHEEKLSGMLSLEYGEANFTGSKRK